jgi:hypothetical protein
MGPLGVLMGGPCYGRAWTMTCQNPCGPSSGRGFGASCTKNVEQQISHRVHLAPEFVKLSLTIPFTSRTKEILEFLHLFHRDQHAC